MNTIAAISWPPPGISTLAIEGHTLFHSLGVLCGFHFFLYCIYGQLALGHISTGTMMIIQDRRYNCIVLFDLLVILL